MQGLKKVLSGIAAILIGIGLVSISSADFLVL